MFWIYFRYGCARLPSVFEILDRFNRCQPRCSLPNTVQSARSNRIPSKTASNILIYRNVRVFTILVKFDGKLISREINFAQSCLQVPAAQTSETVVKDASPNNTTQTADQIRSLVDEHLATSLKEVLPSILKEALAASNAPHILDDKRDDREEEDPSSATSPVSRLNRFYATAKECVLSEPVIEIIKTAFSKQLGKDIWSDLMEKYPQIKGTENVLVAPTMETGTKEYMRQKFGHAKTKELLAFDEGLDEKQAPFLTVARPIATALEKLDENVFDDEGNASGPDPDEIKGLLEDVLVLLGNANVRLNHWRQKRFSEYLNDVGKSWHSY